MTAGHLAPCHTGATPTGRPDRPRRFESCRSFDGFNCSVCACVCPPLPSSPSSSSIRHHTTHLPAGHHLRLDRAPRPLDDDVRVPPAIVIDSAPTGPAPDLLSCELLLQPQLLPVSEARDGERVEPREQLLLRVCGHAEPLQRRQLSVRRRSEDVRRALREHQVSSFFLAFPSGVLALLKLRAWPCVCACCISHVLIPIQSQ